MADSDSDSKLAIAMADSNSKLAQGKARGGGNYIFIILFPRVGNFVHLALGTHWGADGVEA